MKSIGKIVKEARTKKKISYQKLEEITKIRKEFIKAIEKEDWSSLPEFPVVVGFIKNIAEALKLNKESTLAFLRRDYPPQKDLRINPKPDVSKEFSWNPKLTFLAGIAIAVILTFGYLFLQYLDFISPPRLLVDTPSEGQVVKDSFLIVSGKTDPEATLKINNQPVLVGNDGSFSTKIEIFEGTSEVVVVSKSRSGKETVISRKIKPELK